MPLLHCLNLLFCAALGSSLSILSVHEALLGWPVVGMWWQSSWVRNTEIKLHVELSPAMKSVAKELVLNSTVPFLPHTAAAIGHNLPPPALPMAWSHSHENHCVGDAAASEEASVFHCFVSQSRYLLHSANKLQAVFLILYKRKLWAQSLTVREILNASNLCACLSFYP